MVSFCTAHTVEYTDSFTFLVSPFPWYRDLFQDQDADLTEHEPALISTAAGWRAVMGKWIADARAAEAKATENGSDDNGNDEEVPAHTGHTSKWKKRMLAELFGGSTKKPTERLSQDTIEVEGVLMVAFAEAEAIAEAEEDVWPDDGEVEIPLDDESRRPYITNEGKLEETLIDFRELQGEHSSENMAEEVWASLEAYGLQGRVGSTVANNTIVAFVMDHVTNNDTTFEVFGQKCHSQCINFSAIDSHIRCMPHTTHLAAIKLLEAIGIITKTDRKKVSSHLDDSYQETITVPLSRELDIYGEGD
ncbi:hypothetical protein B0H10DRAFT_2231031 [Mycena sp. CBHHK59/15]|nr:hypothetical protein B0H10DRAFT_2231031 [Mycena sp. CBHHK59/15]